MNHVAASSVKASLTVRNDNYTCLIPILASQNYHLFNEEVMKTLEYRYTAV